MTNEIIKILNQMDKEKSEIKDCEHDFSQCTKMRKSNYLSINADWIDYSQDGAHERAQLRIEKELKEIILDAVSDYCMQKKQMHENKIEELVEELKNAPSSATNTEQGNATR